MAVEGGAARIASRRTKINLASFGNVVPHLRGTSSRAISATATFHSRVRGVASAKGEKRNRRRRKSTARLAWRYATPSPSTLPADPEKASMADSPRPTDLRSVDQYHWLLRNLPLNATESPSPSLRMLGVCWPSPLGGANAGCSNRPARRSPSSRPRVSSRYAAIRCRPTARRTPRCVGWCACGLTLSTALRAFAEGGSGNDEFRASGPLLSAAISISTRSSSGYFRHRANRRAWRGHTYCRLPLKPNARASPAAG